MMTRRRFWERAIFFFFLKRSDKRELGQKADLFCYNLFLT